MGKPLDERVATFLRTDRAPITDLKAILPEVEEARARALARQGAAEAESVDLALSHADRDAAAAAAARAARAATAYAEAITSLERKIAAKEASEKRKAKEAERAAALAERDEIAERFAAIVAPMCEALPELFTAVLDNAERMKRAGLQEADAEAKARGLPRTYVAANKPVLRFAEMKIPSFGTAGRVWPPEKHIDLDAHSRLGRFQAREAAAAREAVWGWFRLTDRGVGHAVSFTHRSSPLGQEERRRTLWREPWEGQLRHTEAERLRELGVTVEAIDEPAPEEVE